MSGIVQRIEIQNFKAFRQFDLNVEGPHLLIYGPNGSGKSSLYWALYTFLKSARKPKGSISKYFNPAVSGHLLNIYEQPECPPRGGKITLTLGEVNHAQKTTYCISE